MALFGSFFIALVCVLILQLDSLVSAKVITRQMASNAIHKTDLWQTRVDKVWEMLQDSPCKTLQYGENCTELKSRAKHQMNIYTAGKRRDGNKLVTVLVEKVKGKFTESDAVLVVDPYPDAHFGHTIVVFLVHFDTTKAACEGKGKFYKTGSGKTECISIAQTKTCRNRIGHGRKGRRKCEINFIPLVYADGDINTTQLLRCRSGYQGFGKCPELSGSSLARGNDKCTNSGRCSSQSRRKFRNPLLRFLSVCERCDYAVLVSGGWNVFMNQKRHLDNLRDMRNYLKSKGFMERNMKVFYANNRSIDLDKNKKTKDTVPATEAGGILSHITDICRISTRCIDTFLLYLNGPTMMNGNMLLWDRNRDGIADGTEILKVRQLLEALKNCNASWITIIADQNYAGHLLDRIRDLRARNEDIFKRISVYASTTKKSYTWNRDFTKYWIQRDNIWLQKNQTGVARKMREVYKEVKNRLPQTFATRELSPMSGRNRAIHGNFGDDPGCTITRPSYRSNYRRPSFFELSRKWLRRPRDSDSMLQEPPLSDDEPEEFEASQSEHEERLRISEKRQTESGTRQSQTKERRSIFTEQRQA